MKTTYLLLMMMLLVGIFSPSIAKPAVPKYNLQFPRLAASWDEGIPLGNGMVGALIWQKDDHLRFSLDRADLWDLRPMENFSKPEFSFKWVQQQVKNNNYKVVQDMFDAPYDKLPAPSKIPGAALEFDTKSLGEVLQINLTLNNAVSETKWKNGANLKTFVHASLPLGWFRFENIPNDFVPMLIPPQYQKAEKSASESPVTGQDLQRLGYEQGTVTKESNRIIYRQKGWDGFEYEVAVAWKASGEYPYRSLDNHLLLLRKERGQNRRRGGC